MTDSTGPDVPVLQERLGNVQVLTLNRPDRLNAWTDTLEDRYFELLDEADAHPEVRAVVVIRSGWDYLTTTATSLRAPSTSQSKGNSRHDRQVQSSNRRDSAHPDRPRVPGRLQQHFGS
jgi:enoyl-CoA hydratase/carnithine racemase